MNHYRTVAKEFIVEHKQQVKVASIAIGAILLLGLLIALYTYNAQSRLPKLDYQPATACGLLTAVEAKDILGNDIIVKNSGNPTVSGDRATTNCTYTDKSADNMAVVAVAVRAALNAQGVDDNKRDFASQKAANKVEAVKYLGDDAFFIPSIGQLNILDGKSWILITHGKGDDPTGYTLNDAIKVANYVIEPSVPTF